MILYSEIIQYNQKKVKDICIFSLENPIKMKKVLDKSVNGVKNP